jgi:hypothetical protein
MGCPLADDNRSKWEVVLRGYSLPGDPRGYTGPLNAYFKELMDKIEAAGYELTEATFED